MKKFKYNFVLKINKMPALGVGELSAENIDAALKKSQKDVASDFDCENSHVSITQIREIENG